jgi:23S rRNA pseudouridine1911/1915/1917 synthase
VKEETIQDWVEKQYPEFSNNRQATGDKLQATGDRQQAENIKSQDLPLNPQLTTHNQIDYSSPEQIEKEFISRSGIVHRIDKETSGILLIAKQPEAFFALKQQFMTHTIQKTYLAIVHERLPSTEGEINAPIDRLPWNKEQFGVVPSGKESITHYKVLATYEKKMKKGKEFFQLVECYPKTGRTHQIRVHLKYLNRPILGDYLYAGRKTARDDRTWVSRVMLHAAKIQFHHPVTTEIKTIEAPMPEDMNTVLQSMIKI